jgi:Ribbon-helix-helix protein, copG family
MAQVTLYLDDETADRVKTAAKQAGLSRSQFLARLVREKTATEWPEAVKDLAGAWQDLKPARRLRRRTGRDARRVRFSSPVRP